MFITKVQDQEMREVEKKMILARQQITRKVDELYVDVPHENSVHDCFRADQNIDADGSSSLPPKHNTLFPSISVEDCQPVLEEYNCDGIIHKCKNLEKELKDADGGKESWMSCDKIHPPK